MLNIKAFLANVTHNPGVYQMLDENREVLYIGKARDLKKRLSSYFSGKTQDIKTQALLKHVKDIDITVTHSENEALLLECNLIKKNRPHYNVLFRDDKTYPYILITNEHPYPRIDFYRGNKKKDGLYFGPYPNSTAVRETIRLIQKLFGIRTCNDNFFSMRTRACLHHQIGLCSGSCVGLISKEDYSQDVKHAILFLRGKNSEIIHELQQKMEAASEQLNFELAVTLRDQISRLREIQERQYVSSDQGDADIIGYAYSAGVACIQLLTIRGGRILGSRAYYPNVPANSTIEEILSSFISQHYLLIDADAFDFPKEIIVEQELQDKTLLETTLTQHAQHKVVILQNVRTERKKWLDMAMQSAEQSIATQLLNKAHTQERFHALEKTLHLQKTPARIECFDISHTMGEEAVASCVVFNIQGPVKADYRRFNITGITPGDDIAAMHQALLRRYQRVQSEHTKLPDIILIDGGIAQVGAAQKALQELSLTSIFVMGVAKGVTRKPGFETLIIPGQHAFQLPSDSLALHLIQQIRDEAHRFALIGHRSRRDKKRHVSSLEAIAGIGAKRRRELLRYFGGIQAVNRASLDELAKVPGISRAIAQRIFDALSRNK